MRKTPPDSESVFEALSETLADAKRASRDRRFDADLESTDGVDQTFDEPWKQIDDALSAGDVRFDEALVEENLEDGEPRRGSVAYFSRSFAISLRLLFGGSRAS